jgi:acetyl/propionyl-CoA carboxylase alpha subunit
MAMTWKITTTNTVCSIRGINKARKRVESINRMSGKAGFPFAVNLFVGGGGAITLRSEKIVDDQRKRNLIESSDVKSSP